MVKMAKLCFKKIKQIKNDNLQQKVIKLIKKMSKNNQENR